MITLGEAKQSLARSTDNGVCPDDPRVVDRINEAVARLHALGDWVGTFARFVVAVDPSTRSFTIPTQLQSITRASAAKSVVEGLVCDNEYAFILESAPVLSLRQISPTQFEIIGPELPAAVDVMGKYKLAVAVNDSDALVIDDIYALKLMVLAIFREENNMLDQAAPLVQSALAHLKAKTDSAVANARRALANSMASGLSEGTMGYARAKLALAVSDGLRLDDHALIELLGEAERRLLHRGREWKSYAFRVRDAEFVCPREIESILRVDFDGVPSRINSHWFEYTQNGWGYVASSGSYEVVHRGPTALHTPLPTAGKLTLFTDSPEQALQVRIQGTSLDGLPVVENVVLSGAVVYETSAVFAGVSSIHKDCSIGNLFVIRDGVEVALLNPDCTDSTGTRYRIPTLGDCTERIARVIARPRWTPKLRDTSVLQIDNIPALTNMAMAILAERAGDKENADAFEGRAIRFYEEAFLGKEVSHARRGEVQQRRFSGGTLRAIR